MRVSVRINILGDVFDTDAEDTVLFALQRYAQARGLPLYGFTRFCWNTSCRQCVVKLQMGNVSCSDFACQAPVSDDLQVDSLPQVLNWKRTLLSKSKR
jgi:hypothetical protein